MRILLDTDTCIYMIREKSPGLRRKLNYLAAGDAGVSAITVAELRFGVAKSQARERNASALDAFLTALVTVDVDEAAASAYGDIRAVLEKRGSPIGAMDMLIAAQAVSRDLLLVTNNLREFRRIVGLRCESWA